MNLFLDVLLITAKVLSGFLLFLIALAATTMTFAHCWFGTKYINQLRYRIAIENYRTKKSDERWEKRSHNDHEERDDD